MAATVSQTDVPGMPQKALVLAVFLLVCATSGAAQRRRAAALRPACADQVLAERLTLAVFAVDAEFVYYVDADRNGVMRVPRDGGTSELLARFPGFAVSTLAVDHDAVYAGIFPWNRSDPLDPGEIAAIPKRGGQLRTIARSIPFPRAITTDDTHVYWTAFGTVYGGFQAARHDGRIERARKDGSERETLIGGLSGAWDLVVDGDQVYFTETGEADESRRSGVSAIATIGGPARSLTDGLAAAHMEVTADSVFFAGHEIGKGGDGIYVVGKHGGPALSVVALDNLSDGKAYYACGLPTCTELMAVNLSTGATEVAHSGRVRGNDMELDGCAFYYLGEQGELRRVPRPVHR